MNNDATSLPYFTHGQLEMVQIYNAKQSRKCTQINDHSGNLQEKKTLFLKQTQKKLKLFRAK